VLSVVTAKRVLWVFSKELWKT